MTRDTFFVLLQMLMFCNEQNLENFHAQMTQIKDWENSDAH